MSGDWTELEERVISRAWEDAGFKKQLLTDPKVTLQAELGLRFPEGTEIFVHEETASRIHWVLPRNPNPLRDPSIEDIDEFLARPTGQPGASILACSCTAVTKPRPCCSDSV